MLFGRFRSDIAHWDSGYVFLAFWRFFRLYQPKAGKVGVFCLAFPLSLSQNCCGGGGGGVVHLDPRPESVKGCQLFS